jgi:F-type H+-transporting ATPase subunit delta
MNQSKIAVRYARALFQLALEKNRLDKIHRDIGMVSQALKDFGQFGLYLKSPVVKPSQKLALIREAFTGHIDDISHSFMGLLVQNKRENHLEDIIRRFFDVVREYKGIKSALITSAVPLDDKVREKFHALLSSIFKAEINLEVHHDASILGGFVLQVGDQQYDASVATGLKRMKTALLAESIK